MAKVYLTPIDLQNNEILNAVLHNVPGAQGTTGQPGGLIHYRSDSGYIEWFNAVAGEWMTPGTGEVSDHEGKPDPHSQYLTQAEADALYEDDGAVAAHEAAGDPHPQYQTQAESDARYVNEADHTKAAHDAMGIDAATLDGIDSSGFVGSNAPITGGTHPKITYDSKGLVTGGAALVAGDIPNLATSKITSGTFADARISATSVQQHVGKTYIEGLNINADTVDGQHATALLARANHTGTQPHTTISDFDAGVQANRLDQMAAPTAPVSMNNQRLAGLAEPVFTGDAATKEYVDAYVQGVAFKRPARVATTANVDLSTGGLLTIDGVVLDAFDRVLVRAQTNAAENGIYTAQTGAWDRADDMDSMWEFEAAFVFVEEGSSLGDTAWVVTSPERSDSGTVGTTPVVWTQFSSVGDLIAGAGLTKSGNTLDVGQGNGIVVGADSIAVSYGNVTSLSGANVNGTATTVSRSDHKHALAFGNPVALDGTTNAGSAIVAARADHRHEIPYHSTDPMALGPLSTASPGSSSSVARGDHRHAIKDGPPVGLTPNSTTSPGSNNAVARADHVHNMSGFESAGAATSAVNSHEAAGNPHSQYQTSAEVNSQIDTRVTKAFVDALNVDADTLDGLDSTDFADAGHVHPGAYATTIGNGAATSIAVTHNLGTTDVVIQIQDLSQNPDSVAEADYDITDANTVTVHFSVAPASNSIRVIIMAANDVPANSNVVVSDDVTRIEVMTQAEYDALSPPNGNTLYMISG